MKKAHPIFASLEHLATESAWERVGKFHHHGIALPLSALRNPEGSGIGEFLDLIPLIEWIGSLGFDTIQLLPLNDSGKETSPYSAQSAMALHPIYLTLRELPYLELFPALGKELETLKESNGEKRFDYLAVLKKKEAFLRKYFSSAFSHLRDWPAFHTFVQENPWLEGYALYKTLKKTHNELPWWEWKNVRKQYVQKTQNQEIQYHQCLQFLCFEQMKRVKETAQKEGVLLKGDIPILLSRDSCDVWQHPELFSLEFTAGAPPDMYSKEGQYWGFPLYKWEAFAQNGYVWWKERLNVACALYHLYRLDHIVGFFKIWAIPVGKSAREGFFLPRDESLWIPQGEQILEMMIHSCSMLPIGEDLGAVPASVRRSLEHLGIPGTKVLRWERHWNEDGSFISPSEFHPFSMSCLSTHDSETCAQWWKNEVEASKRLALAHGWQWHEELDPTNRRHLLYECHSSNSLFHINLLQEYLGMFDGLVWSNPEDERINIPGTVSERNWTYRFRPSIEEIITHKKLASLMKELAASSA